ncbi:DUF4390 domain-containing protein [bacterium]|nr:DUF4390 domain-containing protein [bacterium]
MITGLRMLAATALLAAAVPPFPAYAADDGALAIRSLAVERGWVTAHMALVDAFDADMRASLASGLPTTVRFTTELWQQRSRWFDRQVSARVASYRIRWDPGERVFTLTYPGPPRTDAYEDLEPLLAELSVRSIRVHPRGDLGDRHRYFVTAEAAIRPLTLEEFRELDGWIGGRIRGRGDPDGDAPGDAVGPPTEQEARGGGVAQTFFGLLVDLAGFGDVIHRARTAPFRAGDLPETAGNE